MAKKQRKPRDYSNLLRSKTATADLPTPEEVNQKISVITKQPLTPKEFPLEVDSEPSVIHEPVLITEYHLMKDEDLVDVAPKKEKNLIEEKPEKIETEPKRERGRKPLEVKRVPYTTSITKNHKFQIKYHAMKKGIRPSDMLDLILENYFKDKEV